MDPRRTVAIVPPAGPPPTTARSKSLRQQRAFNGADVIKAFVQQSEQRRAQARFHAAAVAGNTGNGASNHQHPTAITDTRWEEREEEQQQLTSGSPRGSLLWPASPTTIAEPPGTTRENLDARALGALFADRRLYRTRRSSTVPMRRPSVLPPHPTAPSAASNNHGSVTTATPAGAQSPSRSLTRRRVHVDATAAMITRPPVPTNPRSRAKNNLAAKLDALAKNSALHRRKVVLSDDKPGRGTGNKSNSPRHGANGGSLAVVDSNNSAAGSSAGTKELSQSELEMKVMTAFRQIVRLWRERKRKAEAAAVSMMNGNANGISTGTGRNGSKLRRDLAAQSNVVGILSRRLIREVPALKFFDDELDGLQPPGSGTRPGFQGTMTSTISAERAKPRGVCYTLDAFGCRKIKMQSSTSIPSRRPNHRSAPKEKHEELTVEKAMRRSLRRKMARRVKSRRQAIMRLSDDFSKARRELSMKLRSQLVLQRAETEKMFNKRLTLLVSDDTNLPPYKAQKELSLARLRCRKANLVEKCQTLGILSRVLMFVEEQGNASGQEVSTGELHFLDLIRCVVEENQVLTPVISEAIRQHMRPQDLHQPLVTELFKLLHTDAHA